MERLFTYGTLDPSHAPAEIDDVLATFVPAGEASVRGHLYQLQEYPGLVLDEAAEPVAGLLFDVPEEAWPRLDAYEGFDAEVRESSLFVRERATVRRPDGTGESVWIYLYNRHTGS